VALEPIYVIFYLNKRLRMGLTSSHCLPAAYQQEQSTKPQTLGYALNDSPAGLLGLFLEKFHHWSDRREANGHVPYSKDFLITNTCLYWLTGNVTSSLRIYYESKHTGDRTNIVSKQYCKVSKAMLVEHSIVRMLLLFVICRSAGCCCTAMPCASM